jgi:choline dehydrogenase-like flavoprotein
MIYMRGQARDYDQWGQLVGDATWGWEHSLPYFMLHEDHKGASATARRTRRGAPADAQGWQPVPHAAAPPQCGR